MEALHKAVGRLAALLALAGGAVLALLVGLTCVSIAGRSLAVVGLGPVPGDFELIETGIAFAVFAFLPLCQYRAGHARVDLFKGLLGHRVNWFLDLFSDLLMLLVSTLIAWTLFQGMLDKFEYGETTFILQLPLGWGYAFSLPGACVSVLTAISCFLQTLTPHRPAGAERPLHE